MFWLVLEHTSFLIFMIRDVILSAVSRDKYGRKPKCDKCRRKPKSVDEVNKFFPSN